MARFAFKNGWKYLACVGLLFAVAIIPGLAQTQLILNGGFESGSGTSVPNWTMAGGAALNGVAGSSQYAHSGSQYMILGAVVNEVDSVYQTISVPSGATSVTLSFWENITTHETTTTTAFDTMTVTIRNTSGTVLQTVASYSNLNKDSALGIWHQKTADLLAYKGQTIRIYFASSNDSTLSTSFEIDDVSVATIAALAPSISSVVPDPVTGSNGLQTITINGANFVNKPTLTLTWTVPPLPPAGGYVVPMARVTFVSGTQLQMSINTTTAADIWTVKATNPDGQDSNVKSFQVVAPASPPSISSIVPDPVKGSNGLQTITINGANFVNKPTLTLTWTVPPLPPAGGYVVPTARVTFVSGTQLQMSINTTTAADIWTMKATNPDGQDSNVKSFQVVAPGGGPPNSAFTGTVDWIHNLSTYVDVQGHTVTGAIDAANVESGGTVTDTSTLLDFIKTKGFKGIIIKAGEGMHLYPFSAPFSSSLVNLAHQKGLKIYGYHYIYGGAYDSTWAEYTTVSGEISTANQILATGCDGLIIDWETEFQNVGGDQGATPAQNAQQYGQGIRAVYPNAFIAHAPIWNPNVNYPVIYQAFNTFCDAVMPQAYCAVGSTASYAANATGATMAANMNSAWQQAYATWPSGAVKPICPVLWAVGKGDPNPTTFTTAAQISQFVDTLKGFSTPGSPGGYQGVSFWASEFHTAAIWNGISGISIGSGGSGASSPVISGAKLTGATFTLTAPSQVGFNYILEYKNSMSDASWIPVQTNGGNGGMIGLTNTGATGPSRFYHIRVQ